MLCHYDLTQWIFHENDFKLSQTMWYVSLRPSTEVEENLGTYYSLTFSRSFTWFPDALYSGTSKFKVRIIRSNNCTREKRGATLPTNMLFSLDSLCRSRPVSWNRNRNHERLNQVGQTPISSTPCFLCLTDWVNASRWDRKIIQHSSWKSLKDWHADVRGWDRILYLTFYSYKLLTTFLPYTNSNTNPQSRPMCAFWMSLQSSPAVNM